jgi:unsaturated rhamnogalacturonyl hydrolase
LLFLYQELNTEKYKKAADLLMKQISTQPRTKQGGFWHKDRYPDQMWLDGLYMLEPFYAEYGKITGQDYWSDIIMQFQLMEKGALDAKTGLLYHAYDHERKQPWANKSTGQSPNFWGRSMGWYMMALVDVLDYMPQNHPKRSILVNQLAKLSAALLKIQDEKTGLWYQVPNFPGRKGNYFEASCANMFVYAMAKGIRKGYLPQNYSAKVSKAYDGILKNFITKDAQGFIHIEKTVSVGGLGGQPYRDGSYEYYLSEPLKTDDLKGAGPFIMASLEMEIAKELAIGKGKKVVLDYYFNHEYKVAKSGKKEFNHFYTWDERKDRGYSLFATQLEQMGLKTDSLIVAPTLENLKNTNIYIIVDPDNLKESPTPNYVQAKDIDEIEKWVKQGGNLILLANDTTNCEIPKFNELAKRFGIEFVGPNLNFVQGTQWEQGAVYIPEAHPIFAPLKKIYVKEITQLKLSKTAKSVLNIKEAAVMAVAQVGKGKVVALGDPWIYNEYLNNRRTPLEFENFKAAKKLIEYLLK